MVHLEFQSKRVCHLGLDLIQNENVWPIFLFALPLNLFFNITR